MSQSFLFFRSYGFRILLVVTFLLAFIWLGTRVTLKSNANNVEDWLPKSYAETGEYQWFLEHFPFESFMVISWEGCRVESFPGAQNDEDMIELFAQKLVPEQTINNMGQWFRPKPIVAELDTSRVEERADSSGENQKPQVADATVEHVKTVEEPITENTTPEYPRKDMFKTVLTYPRLKKMLTDQYPDMTEEEIRERLAGTLIGPDGASTALMVFLKEKPQGKEADEAIARVKQVAQELGIEPIPPGETRTWYQKAVDNFAEMIREMAYGRDTNTDGVIIGGTPVDNASISAEGERTLFRLAGICAIVGIGLAYFCFRSIRLTAIVFWVAILSAGISLAIVALTGSRCDAIMLSMPALVYIMAMSGSIHMINYYHDAIREQGLSGAPERAFKLGWLPCLIAILTTAFGLASLCTSDLVPIRKFGIYSALGVIAALAMIFLFLPSILYFFPSRKYAAKFGGKGLKTEDSHSGIFLFWRWFGKKIIRHCNAITVVAILLMVFFAFGLPMIRPEVKMMKFYSKDAPIITNYTWLEKHIGPLVPMEVVLKFDKEKCPLTNIQKLRLVKKVSEILKTEHSDAIGGVLSAATMAPSPEPPESRGLFAQNTRRAYETVFNEKIDQSRDALKDYVATDLPNDPGIETLDLSSNEAAWLRANGMGTVTQLLRKTTDIPDDMLAPYRKIAQDWENEHGVDLWRISLRVWALGEEDIDYAQLMEEIKANIDAELTSDNIKTIADPMGDNIASAGANGLVIDGVDVVYTGMVPLVYKTQHALTESLYESVFWSFTTIAIVFFIVLKSVPAGLLVMIPNAFPVLVVFGFLGWIGMYIDVGTMMTASVALGVTVDNSMHYLTWFRDGLDRGLKPDDAALEAYERCATAMSETVIIGGLGLSAFSFSTFTPTQMFGNMMLAILTVSIVGDMVFMPAILNGSLGKFFIGKWLKRNQKRILQEKLQETPPVSPEQRPGEAVTVFQNEHPYAIPASHNAETNIEQWTVQER